MKFGSAVTVIAIVTLFVIVPETPVTVMVALPGTALDEAENVSTLVRVVEAGLKVAVTPAGSPASESSIMAAKPFWRLAVIVLVAVLSWATFRLEGVAKSAKFGAARTCKASVVVLRRLPEVAVMVTVHAPT